MPVMLDMYDSGLDLHAFDETLKAEVFNEVIDQINHEFPPTILRNPREDDRKRIRERVESQVTVSLRRRNCRPGVQQESALAEELTRRIVGLGFLDLLLPPARTDISEITIYSSGLLQIMRKGSVRWDTIDLRPEPGEIWRVLDRLIGPQNKTLNETNPSINAKLPATKDNPGGGRIKALHPVIAPPGKNPSINIRLYEQKPVRPDWLLERGVMNEEMMNCLRQAMEQGKRILISGGTRTGKTTLLSALCNFLPPAWRIVKIEDPEEIWVDRPTVQTVEARPQAIGTDVRPYTLPMA
jgi:pilus assembly protein CpaF